jgi:hypothetical protein
VKITVTQTGGLLGVPTRVELDSAQVPEQDAAEIERRAKAVRPSSPTGGRGYPGEIGYALDLEPRDGPPIHAEYLDGSMPDSVRQLVAWVQDHPRSRQTSGPGAPAEGEPPTGT